jgi:energy-coupling factor transport system substrate-specific component
MSWPVATFSIVALVLFAGWVSYERSHPSARMIAVVATLAAVAALGRDAFVALPDVKPITTITFVAGYALGPLAGFTLGSLGMLTSNIVLSQGPYTPWQMAAWGLVGLAGAALGAVTGRRVGRVGFAVACALAAAGAKEIMNVYTWSVGASHTPAAFLAIAGTALAFDITDAVSSAAFALAFAPELARLLARARARMEVRWEGTPADFPPTPAGEEGGGQPRPLGAGGAPVALLLALVLASATAIMSLGAPQAANASSLSREVSFLASVQNGDGGFGAARGQATSELYSAWAAMGLASAGRNPAAFRRGDHSVCDALRARIGSLSGVADYERTVLAARACGASAYSFAGRDLVAEVMRARRSDGSFGEQVNLTSFAIFALASVGHSSSYPPIRRAAGWIEHQQNADGGFSFGGRSGTSDVDDTAAVLQALIDAGARDQRVRGTAWRYLMRSQNPDGGFPQQRGGESNAQSTAWAVQGLIAGGVNPATVHRGGSRSPIGYLESLVTSGGSIRYSRTSAQTPVWVTAQALVALARRVFPVVR